MYVGQVMAMVATCPYKNRHWGQLPSMAPTPSKLPWPFVENGNERMRIATGGSHGPSESMPNAFSAQSMPIAVSHAHADTSGGGPLELDSGVDIMPGVFVVKGRGVGARGVAGPDGAPRFPPAV